MTELGGIRQINLPGHAHHIFTHPFRFSGPPPPAIPFTLESRVDVGQGKFAKKNKRRALNNYLQVLHIAQKSIFTLFNKAVGPGEKNLELIIVGRPTSIPEYRAVHFHQYSVALVLFS